MCYSNTHSDSKTMAAKHCAHTERVNMLRLMALLSGTHMKITSQHFKQPPLLLPGTKDSSYGNIQTLYVEENHQDLRSQKSIEKEI